MQLKPRITLEAPPLELGDIERIASAAFERVRAAKGDASLLASGLNYLDYQRLYIAPVFGTSFHDDCFLGFDEAGARMMGVCDPLGNRIFVCSSLAHDPRRAFTAYHEAAHAILHAPYFRSQLLALSRDEQIITVAEGIEPHTESTLEKQANALAGRMAAPLWLVDRAILIAFCDNGQLQGPIRFHTPGRYSCYGGAVVSSFREYCWHIARRIQPWFGGLSAESLGYQVQRCSAVRNDPPTPVPLGGAEHFGSGRLILRRTG